MDDLILTITGHDCTKGVSLSLQETINAEELGQGYKDQVFPFCGKPTKIISARDTRFTSQFFGHKEICAH